METIPEYGKLTSAYDTILYHGYSGLSVPTDKWEGVKTVHPGWLRDVALCGADH